MIFYTRELYQGIQPNSGWERRAQRAWGAAADTYAQYFRVISPLLPRSVRRLCSDGPHDGVVLNASHRSGELMLVLDVAHALGQFRNRRPLQLRFRGVTGRMRVAHLIGRWWLYQEAHLRSRGRFSVHVLFDCDELEIDAEQLLIARGRGESRRRR